MFLKVRFSPKCYKLVIRPSRWTVSEQVVIAEPYSLHLFGGHHLKAFLRQIGKKVLLPSSQLLIWIQTWCLVCAKVIAQCVRKWDLKKAEFSSVRKWDAELTAGEGGCLAGLLHGGLCSASLILPSIFSGNGLLKTLKKSFLVCIANLNYKLYVRFKDALYAYLSMFIDAIMLEEKLMQILSIFRKTEP